MGKNTVISKFEDAKLKGAHFYVSVKDFLVSLKEEPPQSIHLRVKDSMEAQKTKFAVKAQELLTKVSEKLSAKVVAVSQTSLFKQALQMVIAGSEKTMGKERTANILSKIETWIPLECKSEDEATAVESVAENALRQRGRKKGNAKAEPNPN